MIKCKMYSFKFIQLFLKKNLKMIYRFYWQTSWQEETLNLHVLEASAKPRLGGDLRLSFHTPPRYVITPSPR